MRKAVVQAVNSYKLFWMLKQPAVLSLLFICPSFQVSMVAYAKPSELKKDLNEQFREKFPNLNITLTKLRRYMVLR